MYEKQNFVKGQLLKADHLNHIEDGVTALSEEIAKLPSGGGSAIVDVTKLPETDEKDSLYRLLEGTFYYNGYPFDGYTCEVVETLPGVGEPATDATMSTLYGYYAKDTEVLSGYLPDSLAGALGVPAGWYPMETLMQVAGFTYGGVVSNAKEMSEPEKLYLLLEESVKYYSNGAWKNVQGIGWHGDEGGAEIFNSLTNVASGAGSHAEGLNTTASGENSHAEGDGTTASGLCSHAEGQGTTASGNSAHAEGHGTIAASMCQHVIGKYNNKDTSNTYVFIVGNGEAPEGGSKRDSNAHTLDWSGNAWYRGTVESAGMLLTSPNGTKYKIVVSDDGTLTATAVAE